MTEIRGTLSAKAPYFASTRDKDKKQKSEIFNPEYADLMFVDGKIIKLEKSDEVLPEGLLPKLKANLIQTSKLPEYAARGLKGDKNANFFEFLQLGKIPYWIGGSTLVGCFLAGGKKAKPVAKEIAAGVALYYAADKFAKALVDGPVRFFKGIDLNRKYKDIISLKLEADGKQSGKKSEYHNVYESIDFTRWDLLYKEDSESTQNPKDVNSEYDKIAQNMGLTKNLNDPDSTVKPYVKKIIVASRAWKSALIVPLAALSAGLSKYEGWQTWGNELGGQLGHALKSKTLPEKAGGLLKVANRHFVKPLKQSFVDLWSGKSLGGKAGGKLMGRATIAAPVLATLAANLNILGLSYLKEDKYIDSSVINAISDATTNATTSLTNGFKSMTTNFSNTVLPKKDNEYIF